MGVREVRVLGFILSGSELKGFDCYFGLTVTSDHRLYTHSKQYI